jgi:DNA invertase Pin-like site-specific DNA recombinase
MKVGIAYIRKSKGEGQDESDSQRKAVAKWLRDKNLTAEFIEDAGSRDLSWKRTGFLQMMARVERGEIDWIAVNERDRFGVADNEEWGYYITILRRHSCKLYIASEDKEITARTDAAEPFMAAVAAGQSRREQEDKAIRCHRGKLSRVELGQWPGGRPPLGYDLICSTELGGRECWRLTYQPGQYRRVRIWPDGRKERFDGKDNVPGRNKGEYLFLAPSCNKQQIEWMRKIFEWFVQGDTYRNIAVRLNQLKVDAPYRKGWVGATVQKMLIHPSYVLGVPCWNKAAHGRFIERLNGEWLPVERLGNRVKAGRVRSAADHVHAKQTAGGIIDVDTWNKTQARIKALAETPRVARRPKNPDLFLSGLVVCADCGQTMVAWSQHMSYRCSSNMHDGNMCRCNKSRHDVIEEYLIRFLDESHASLSAMIANPEQVAEVVELQAISTPLVAEFTKKVTAMWREARKQQPGEHWTYRKLRAALGDVHQDQAKALAKEIKEKEKELATLTAALGRLKNEDALTAMAERIDAVGAELRDARDRAKPVLDQLDQLRDRLRVLLEQTREAIDAVSLKRSEAVREVVGRITVHHEARKMGRLRASRLVRVTITPKIGRDRDYRVECDEPSLTTTQPGPD